MTDPHDARQGAADGTGGSDGEPGEGRDERLAGLLAAREGTGVGFPGALADAVRADAAGALADARAWSADASATVRLVALELLTRLEEGDEDFAAAARAAAHDADDDLRWAAAKALGSARARTSGTEGAVAALVELLRDEDADVRWQAISSLPLAAGSPPDPAAVTALVAATTDADDDVADHAVFALGLQLDVDTPPVRDAIAAHLGADDRPDTASAAALALAQRGDERAAVAVAAALRAAVEDDEALVDLEPDWLAAAGALLRSPRPPAAGGALRELVQEVLAREGLPPDVAEAAREALRPAAST